MSVFGRARNVVAWMAQRAQVRADGIGLFYGTPRPYMERNGASSGPLYQALADLGLVRKGHGKKAVWTIPLTLMQEFQDCDVP